MNEKTKRALEDIVEIADRLNSHHFQEAVEDKGLGFSTEGTPDGKHIFHFEFPDDTVIDATLYNLRLFDQQGEGFSFHRLEQLTDDMSLSDYSRKEFLKIRDIYFFLLSKHPKLVKSGFFEENTHPNNGEILRVVINGGYGHRKDFKKREQYKTWTRDDVREAVLYQVFSHIVYNIINMIDHLRTVALNELDRN